MSTTTLICTVGGSHQPILTAIKKTQPDFVCFICTDRDPESGKPGSITQITGKGNIISERPRASPTLPNIPIQAGMSESDVEVLIVPADDLDIAFSRIRERLIDLSNRFPDGRLIADYTGGTKTMTAALVTAVLETNGVDLQLVTGARADLVKVADHTQYAIAASVDRIRLEREMAPFLNSWRRYAYDEAAEGLAGLDMPRDSRLRAHLNLTRNLSRAFAAWDRFDHEEALESLEPFRARIGAIYPMHLTALSMLIETGSKRREPLQLFDLWFNAQRRAAQGRYDDAVARVYRLLEWSAQWQLKSRQGIDTADVRDDQIPEGVELTRNREGRYQAGLYQAWVLVERKLEGPAAAFARSHGKELLEHLQARNASILAHGFNPVSLKVWTRLQGWMDKAFIPMLKTLARDQAGIRFDPKRIQLPTDAPGSGRE